jgi:hypothetical protein
MGTFGIQSYMRHALASRFVPYFNRKSDGCGRTFRRNTAQASSPHGPMRQPTQSMWWSVILNKWNLLQTICTLLFSSLWILPSTCSRMVVKVVLLEAQVLLVLEDRWHVGIEFLGTTLNNAVCWTRMRVANWVPHLIMLCASGFSFSNQCMNHCLWWGRTTVGL